MKKFSVLALSMLVALAVVSCSSAKKVETKPATTVEVKKEVVPAKPDPKVVACKAACDKTAESCVKKAGKDAAKKAACDTAKAKCAADCEKK